MRNNLVIELCRTPNVGIQDIFKFLYQSCFGCEHLISDYQSALRMIKQETESSICDNLPEIEMLDGDFCRLHLKCGLSVETLCRLFMISSEKQTDGKERLKNELNSLIEMSENGDIPFDVEEIKNAVELWKNRDFPAVHHSDDFRNTYHPAYRVIRKEYLRILPLLIEIDKLLLKDEQKTLIVAIDGRCASGKTTVSEELMKIYNCNVFHLDDYFLQPHQRTEERISKAGENVDHERFLEEILLPLSQNKDVISRPFNCRKMCIDAPEKVAHKRLNIVEGSYCLHPELCKYYNLKVFSDIDENQQKERIRNRNSAAMAEKFFSVWIPLEENYFNELKIREKADITLNYKVIAVVQNDDIK